MKAPSGYCLQMENQRFGKLVVVGSVPSIPRRDGKKRAAVLVRCDCGGEKVVFVYNLKSGNTKSCGCDKRGALRAHNAKRAEPQTWVVAGDEAHIFINDTRVIVDAADVPLVGQYRWHLNGNYPLSRGGRLAMHRLILGLEKGDKREGDHRNHIPTDNRRGNLRIATSSQNKWNQRKRAKPTTSRFKGVHWCAGKGRWTAQIKTGGRVRLIGRYRTETEAARAYSEAASKNFGEYAHLDEID